MPRVNTLPYPIPVTVGEETFLIGPGDVIPEPVPAVQPAPEPEPEIETPSETASPKRKKE